MKKITVVGNAAGGKSTLSRRLSRALNIDVYHLDQLFLRPDGTVFPEDERLKIQDDIIAKPSWIIEGVGSLPSIVLRFMAADTIIIIDHPICRLYYLGIKRFLKNLFYLDKTRVNVLSAIAGIKKVLVMPWQLHHHVMPQILNAVETIKNENQTVVVLKSFPQINQFVRRVSPGAG